MATQAQQIKDLTKRVEELGQVDQLREQIRKLPAPVEASRPRGQDLRQQLGKMIEQNTAALQAHIERVTARLDQRGWDVDSLQILDALHDAHATMALCRGIVRAGLPGEIPLAGLPGEIPGERHLAAADLPGEIPG